MGKNLSFGSADVRGAGTLDEPLRTLLGRLFFHRSPFLRRLARFYILLERTINIMRVALTNQKRELLIPREDLLF